MKLRIRFSHILSQSLFKSCSVIVASDSHEHVTLADLKRSVYEYVVKDIGCEMEQDGWKHVTVSLDGHHPLAAPLLASVQHGASPAFDRSEDECDDTTSLQSLGVVRGDTIYVLGLPCHIQCTQTEDRSQPSEDQNTMEVSIDSRGMPQSVLLQIEQYVQERWPNCKLTRNDALALIIHGGLVDYGFDCCQINIEDIIGNVCKKNECVYEINYVLQIEKPAKRLELVLYLSMQRKNAMLVMQFPHGGIVSKLVVIPGEALPREDDALCRNYKVLGNALLWNDEECFRMLTVCKDAFCRHVLSLSCAKLDIEYPGACLIMMPADVKRKILSFLSFEDLCSVGMTCHEFCMHHRDNRLWVRLLNMYFQKETGMDSNVYGKYAAKQEFKRLMLAKREALSRPRDSHTFGGRWIPPPTGWGQPRPRLPGIIGGDYDRFPPGLPRLRGSSRISQWRLE